MAIEIVSFPIKNGGSFHSYVKLPEGMQIKWGWVKTLVPFVHPKIAGIYGCSSH